MRTQIIRYDYEDNGQDKKHYTIEVEEWKKK